jgi:hypothetical protein
MKTTILIAGLLPGLCLHLFSQQSVSPPTANTAPINAGEVAVSPAPPVALKGGSNKNYAKSANAFYANGMGGVTISSSVGNSAGIPPLVLRFTGGDEEANNLLEEDLNIMTRLVERALQHGMGEEAPEMKLGIPMLFSDSRSVRGIYLEGFGALFMIKVRFPVFAPSAQPESKEPAPISDSEWDKAKRELYGESDNSTAETAVIGSGSHYDAAQVEELRKVLLQTLKYAANIHQLKPEDSVAISVFGQPPSLLQVRKARSTRSEPIPLNRATASGVWAENATARKSSAETAQIDQKVRAGILASDSALLRTSNQGTVLTLRAKKADIDAFASGKLDFEAFAKKAERNSYAGNGYGITSINSWSKARGSSSSSAP